MALRSCHAPHSHSSVLNSHTLALLTRSQTHFTHCTPCTALTELLGTPPELSFEASHLCFETLSFLLEVNNVIVELVRDLPLFLPVFPPLRVNRRRKQFVVSFELIGVSAKKVVEVCNGCP